MTMESLASGPKWERTANGIRVEHRMPRDRTSMLRFLKASLARNWPTLIVFLPVGAIIAFSARHDHRIFWWGYSLALFVGAMLGDFISMLANRTILTLDAEKLKLEFLRWNSRRKQKVFLTEHLHDLRFAKSTRRADIRNALRLNEMQFDRNFATQYFAPGITEEDAAALIARMKEIYPFPKYPPS
jgi:hypothetical protein